MDLNKDKNLWEEGQKKEWKEKYRGNDDKREMREREKINTWEGGQKKWEREV